MIKIVKWWNSDVVYESEKETIREAVIEAVEKGANLRDANLGGANLEGADLRDANLRGANLGDANLGDADLGGANFYHAQFYGRGGSTKIKETQVEQFHQALGIVIIKE